VALGLNEVFEGRPYITCVYLTGAGIEGVYRKSYLWPHKPPEGEWIHHQQGYRMERGIIAPGDGTKNVRVGDLLIGTLICADGAGSRLGDVPAGGAGYDLLTE
jgi:predicted amidohydrolase